MHQLPCWCALIWYREHAALQLFNRRSHVISFALSLYLINMPLCRHSPPLTWLTTRLYRHHVPSILWLSRRNSSSYSTVSQVLIFSLNSVWKSFSFVTELVKIKIKLVKQPGSADLKSSDNSRAPIWPDRSSSASSTLPHCLWRNVLLHFKIYQTILEMASSVPYWLNNQLWRVIVCWWTKHEYVCASSQS